jgi:hypothetical protein
MGKNLSKRLCDLFYATRKRFNDDITDIAIANKAYRLRVLDRMAADTEGRKNYKMTAAFLEQAAKEVGDAYSREKPQTGGNDVAEALSALIDKLPG